MKKTNLILLTVLCFTLMAGVALAGVVFQPYWSISNTGDATGPTSNPAGVQYLAFDGVPAIRDEVPVIENLSVTSDVAGSVATILSENGDSTTMDAASDAGALKVLPVTATTSFQDTTAGQGSWVAIVDWTNQKFEINRVSSITAGVSLNLVRNLSNTYASGSSVYEMTSIGTFPVGNASVSWPAVTIYGKKGKCLGVFVPGTSAASINYGAGSYK
jgi:hypothetical protein